MAIAIDNLNEYKTFSFDVWNTLIKANHEYTFDRNRLLSLMYGLSFSEAGELYTTTKFFLDQIAEIGKVCLTSYQCWELLDANIRRFISSHGDQCPDVDLPSIIDQCENAFINKPPIFTQDTKDLLVRLKQNGCQLAIISNTNFINGSLLFREVFSELDVFTSGQFSDAQGKPKPHSQMFFNTKCALSRVDIVHVGDNLICDGAATRMGFAFQHVKNPADLVAIFKSVGL